MQASRRSEALQVQSGLRGDLRWIRCHNTDVRVRTGRMGQLPASLKALDLRLEVLLRTDVFARCTNLRKLELEYCGAVDHNRDFSNCTSLHRVMLSWDRPLKTCRG